MIGAQLLADAGVDVIGFQELVGRAGPGKPSAWASQVLAALGPAYRLVTPTTALNENYIAYLHNAWSLVQQHDDVILTSSAGGRHLTSATFRDRSSGRLLWIGNTHLVAGKNNGTSRSRQAAQIADVLDGLDLPYIVLGDMNRSDLLPQLGARSTSRKGATYTRYADATRSSDPDHEFDHIYARQGVTFADYALLGVNGSTFTTPMRPSDHVPVVATLTFKD